MSDIGLFEAMYSVRALRRLKPDPASEEIIAKILDAKSALVGRQLPVLGVRHRA
jgi:hypothetical protein